MTKYAYTGPEIDHSLLSPSGHVSKSARVAAMKRETDRLFPPGFWDKPQLTMEERTQQEVCRLLRTAKSLRELAARGMSQRKFTHAAEKLEKQAKGLGKSDHWDHWNEVQP